jgi:hypothetical protein
MVVRPLLLAGCVALGLCVSASASAYCRTHTDDPPASSCPEGCKEEGLPLYWARSQLTYAFNQKGFPGLSDEQLRSIVGSSFRTWESVTCGGESSGLNFSAYTAPTPLQEGPREAEPNTNVIAHLTAEEWRARRYDSQAYAITAVWFNPENGEIMGADMLFNGRMDNFGVCSNQGCVAGDPETDLRNVATHEIGHFIGLSHSDVEESTMWCGAMPNEIKKRSLSVDDVDGLCDIYPPGGGFRKDQAVTRSGGGPGCSAGASGTAPGTLLELALLLLPAWLGRRRRAA